MCSKLSRGSLPVANDVVTIEGSGDEVHSKVLAEEEALETRSQPDQPTRACAVSVKVVVV